MTNNATKNSHNVASVLVHTQDQTIENFLSDMYFGHGDDIHGHTLHGLVRHWHPMGFPPDIPIVMIAGLTDRITLSDLLDGIVEADLIDPEPALHVWSWLLNPWVHHVVVPSFTELKHTALRY